MSVFTRLLKAGEGKKVRRLAEIVPLINELEPEMQSLSDADLRAKTDEFKARLSAGETLDDLLVEAFAVVREAALRVTGQRHYDVQLMGGMALHFGWIAEMKTGEGKTLVSTLPVYLNALSGKGVHVVTVNDYLAHRDATTMGKIYSFLGLSTGLVLPSMEAWWSRQEAYNSDVTYGTNTEFGFDYLRDNMARSLGEMVQRGHHYAIVDEVDSILIDEARTPLIISGPSDQSAQLYYQFASIVRTLRRDEDYEVDEEKKLVIPTESGIEKVEKQLGLENLYDLGSINLLHQLNQALRAKELYKRDKDYIVDKGEVNIVDEFTGRVLEGRRWSEGLHQAVEAKERVRIKEENHTWATVTLQNYFRMYEKLAGMTGTAETEASEFASTYNLPVVPIPTHKEMIRRNYPDVIFKSELAKFNAIVEDIKERHRLGQPVLVGTASVVKSEILSQMLTEAGIPHNVLNAKQHFREAEVVAQAGRLGGVTVATNMAGRGVDILLGGNPEGAAVQELVSKGIDPSDPENAQIFEETVARLKDQYKTEGDKVRELGGLYVLGSERHESRRIDNQLRGRSGRQGDPGESRFYLSLEDELMRLFATGAVSYILDRTFPDDLPIEHKMVSKAIERAQSTVEGKNAEIRKEVLKYDEVLDAQRKVIYRLRRSVLEGQDLRERTIEIVERTLDQLIEKHLSFEFQEQWDLPGLVTELHQYYPTTFTVEELSEAVSREQIYESLRQEILAMYEKRELEIPGGVEVARALERDVMLAVIDQRWREHLSEMDSLREGINLRAMGQQDPLVAWQREGFAMFTRLIELIDDDYFKYIFHVELVQEEAAGADLSKATYIGQNEPVMGLSLVNGGQGTIESEVVSEGAPELNRESTGSARGSATEATILPFTKIKSEKLGRNDPCWCDSGQKFKNCHGKRDT